MRILYLTPTRIYSGGEKVTLDVAQAMRARGHEVIYCGLDGPVRQAAQACGVFFECLPAFGIAQVRSALSAHAPHMVHCMDFRASTYASLFGVPFVAHLHNNPPWLRSYGPNAWAMLFFSLRAKGIIAVSPSVYGEFALRHLLHRHVTLLPNCVDVASIRSKSRESPTLPENFDVAFMGRFVEQKRPVAFVETVARLRRDFPDLRALMLGEGDLIDEVRSAIAMFGLESTITLAGYKANPFPWLAVCKVLIMPSAWEGFGLAAVEAMALGKPVVACSVGGLRGIVDESCGALCPTAATLADATVRILADSQLYTAMADAAVRRAESFSNCAAYYDAVEALYHA